MRFKDESGAEFEMVLDKTLRNTEPGLIVIRPVKAEPKWHLELEEHNVGHDLVLELTDTSKDQAQLIKEAVTELMEYVTGGADWTPDFDKLTKARQAIGDK